MAEQQDWLSKGIEVTKQLWGDRAGGQELPAQRSAPEFFAIVTQSVFELKGHLAAALRLGITRRELIEVLMQTACYAGVPAAVSALNAAAAVLGDD